MADYPFFGSMLISAGMFLLCLGVLPNQRKAILMSACLGAPCSLLALFVVPEYWNPRKIVDLPVGIEDVLFCISTGGIAHFFFCLFLPRESGLSAGIVFRPERYIFAAVIGWVLMETLRWMGRGNTESVWITIYLMGIPFLWRRTRLAAPAVMASLLFTGVYALLAKGMLTLWPEMLAYWRHSVAGDTVGGLPIMEYIWALGYGFTWPLFMAYVFDLEPAYGSIRRKDVPANTASVPGPG